MDQDLRIKCIDFLTREVEIELEILESKIKKGESLDELLFYLKESKIKLKNLNTFAKE